MRLLEEVEHRRLLDRWIFEGQVTVIFMGTVRRRSSADPPRQPEVAGEAEVFRRNPKRKRRIMRMTGWKTVFDGTLNLVVAKGVLADLRDICPLFHERPEDIEHPTNRRIPEIRRGYYYYEGTASVRGKTQEVLVRRAGNPHDERCVELVASVKLMEHFQIDEDSKFEVAVGVGGVLGRCGP